MALSRSFSCLAALALFSLLAADASAQARRASKPAAAVPAAAVPLKASTACEVMVLGDSGLQKWKARATDLRITGEVRPGAGSLLRQLRAGALTGLELAIGVAGLRTDAGGAMDKSMWKALEAEKFPFIRFSLKSYTVTGDRVTARGRLTIHGVGKDVELTGKLAARGEGASVTGSYDTAMTEFNVQPPSVLLGTVQVKDNITITYYFDLAR